MSFSFFVYLVQMVNPSEEMHFRDTRFQTACNEFKSIPSVKGIISFNSWTKLKKDNEKKGGLECISIVLCICRFSIRK